MFFPRSWSKAKRRVCLILIIFIGLFIYAPPFCIGCTQHNLPYLIGPDKTYELNTLAGRGALPIIIIYLAIYPEDVNKKGHMYIDTPMGYALARGHFLTALYLHYQGGYVEGGQSGLFSTILLPSNHKYIRAWLAKRMINRGIDVNCSSEPHAPLFSAALAGKLEIVELLLDKGADVNVRTDKGETPLMAAAERCNKEIVDTLISKGADVNAQSNEGKTALMESRCCKDINVAFSLLANGADYSLKDNEGETIMEKIVSFHNPKCARTEILDYILGHGGNPNLRNKDGRTLLHIAIEESWPREVEVLIRHRADPTLTDNNGRSAFDSCIPIDKGLGPSKPCLVLKKYYPKELEQVEQEKLKGANNEK